MTEQNKKHKSIDDFLEELRLKHAKNLDDSFKHYDEMTSEKIFNNLYNNILTPAHDDMYNSIVEQLDKDFKKDDEAKVHTKPKELKKAAVEGLKKYFEKAEPGVLKAIEGMEEIEEQYEYLVKHYDENVAAGQEGGGLSIRGIVERLSKKKKTNVGHIKTAFGNVKDQNKKPVLAVLEEKAHIHYFGTYHDAEVGAHVEKELKDKGIEVEDKTNYILHNKHNLVRIHKGAKKGDWAENEFEKYGLKYEEKK